MQQARKTQLHPCTGPPKSLGQPLSKSAFCRPRPWEAPGKPLSKSGFCKPCPWKTTFEKWFLQATPLGSPWDTTFEKWFLQAVPSGNHFRIGVFAGHVPGKPFSTSNLCRSCPGEAPGKHLSKNCFYRPCVWAALRLYGGAGSGGRLLLLRLSSGRCMLPVSHLSTHFPSPFFQTL